MEVLGQVQFAAAALLHYCFGVVGLVLVLEGREPAYHLADEDSDAPQVSLVGVAYVREHDFRRAIARRPADSIGPIIIYVLHLLCKPEVDQLDMPLRIYKDVLWLQISINDASFVQTFNRQNNLRKVKASVLLRHENTLANLFDELATGQELEDHVQLTFVLESLVYPAAEIVRLELFEDVSLVQYVLNLLFAADALFLEAFQSVELLRLLIADKLDDAEGALAQRLQDLEVVNLQCLATCLQHHRAAWTRSKSLFNAEIPPLQ